MSVVYNGVILEPLSVDVSRENEFAPRLVKQGDAYTRGFVVTLNQNGEPLTIPSSGTTALLNCQNQTDLTKKSSQVGAINNDGTVTVIVPAVVMEDEGYIYCDISVITASGNDTHVLKSTLFVLSCEKAANKDGTSSVEEDTILAGIMAGTIHIPDMSAGATIINTTTVPESAQWTTIPTTYAGETGEVGEIALWEGHGLWYLKAVGGITTTTYTWKQLGEQEDIDDLEANKMDMNGTELSDAAINDLPAGQVFVSSDTDIAIGIKTATEGEEGDRRAPTKEYVDSNFANVRSLNYYATLNYVDQNCLFKESFDPNTITLRNQGDAYRFLNGGGTSLKYSELLHALFHSQNIMVYYYMGSYNFIVPLIIDLFKYWNVETNYEINAHYIDHNGQRIDLVGTGTKNETVALNAPAT